MAENWSRVRKCWEVADAGKNAVGRSETSMCAMLAVFFFLALLPIYRFPKSIMCN